MLRFEPGLGPPMVAAVVAVAVAVAVAEVAMVVGAQFHRTTGASRPSLA